MPEYPRVTASIYYGLTGFTWGSGNCERRHRVDSSLYNRSEILGVGE